MYSREVPKADVGMANRSVALKPTDYMVISPEGGDLNSV